MALLPLELKIFELLSQKLAPLIDEKIADLKELHLDEVTIQLLKNTTVDLDAPKSEVSQTKSESIDNLSQISEEYISPAKDKN
jgi:S-adenosylmethionine synthetase